MKKTLHYPFDVRSPDGSKSSCIQVSKSTGLTPSQPKIPDYLLHHDGLIHCRHFTKTDWGNAKIMTYVSNPMFGDERDGSDYC